MQKDREAAGKSRRRRVLPVSLLSCVLRSRCFSCYCPYAPSRRRRLPRKGGGGPPKNLKLLKPEDLRAGVMRQFTQALSVRCDHCHVQGDNASDDNPKKNVARMMITMVREINGKFPDAKEHVTCYTCHRGKVTPETAPPPAAPPAQ